MATLYYNNGQSDGDIGNILNWWADSGFTIPGTIPTTGDTAIIFATTTASTNTADACAPTNLTIDGSLSCNVAVVTDIVVASGGSITAGTISATTVTVNGTGAISGGGITANVVVNSNVPTAVGGATITGNLTYAGVYVDAFPANAGGVVFGTDSITNSVTFTGADNSASPTNSASATVIFTNRDNTGSFTCAAFTMTGSASQNSGTVAVADAVFATGAQNSGGTITGNASFGGPSNSSNFFGTVSGTITLDATFTLEIPTSDTFSADTSGWSINAACTFTFTGTGANTGILPRGVFTGAGTNAGGTITTLTVPGTQAGSRILCNFTQAELGTFGTLTISGIAASTGGAGPTRIGKGALIG